MSDRHRHSKHKDSDDRRRRSASPADERDSSRGRKRSYRDFEEGDGHRHSSRDRRDDRPRSRPRSAERYPADEAPSQSNRRWHNEGEPELISEGFEGNVNFAPGHHGPEGQGRGRGPAPQGRTGRGSFGGPGRSHGEWDGGRFGGRMRGRGREFGDFSGRGDFGMRGRGRGFIPRGGFNDRGRGRFPGRGWVGRGPGRFGGDGGMDDQMGPPMFARRGGRFDGMGGRGRFGELGPSGMRAGRGFGGPGGYQGPNNGPGGFQATPRQPAIDPAVRERRNKSIAARLKRQVKGLQLSADLVEESVLERFAEIEAGDDEQDDSKGDSERAEMQSAAGLKDMYMFRVLGGDDKDRLPICQQRFDQTQAFEYCLQLYQAVPEVRISKYGHFVVPAAAA